jgi:hypothetical protein
VDFVFEDIQKYPIIATKITTINRALSKRIIIIAEGYFSLTSEKREKNEIKTREDFSQNDPF